MEEEYAFHIQHWPALGEWVIEPCPGIVHGLCIADSGSHPGALGMLGVLSRCRKAARGRAYHVVITSRDERIELHSPPTLGWFGERKTQRKLAEPAPAFALSASRS